MLRVSQKERADMKIVRLGPVGAEKPAVMIDDKTAVFVDDLVADFDRGTISSGKISGIRESDLAGRTPVNVSDYRVGAPIATPGKIVCIGLNYARHARESGMEPPSEPVIFMKAPDTLVGPHDDILIPPNSEKTDYEVELAVIIGKRALYLKSPEDSLDHVFGYSVSQDVSERYWQMERGGQWVKGKSFPTFNPMGPCIVTADSLDASDLHVWTTIDGEMRQDSRSSDFIFDIPYVIWYVSQVMELQPGDIINTGTPEGVGLGFKPPKYLVADQEVASGIEGIGTIKSMTRKTTL